MCTEITWGGTNGETLRVLALLGRAKVEYAGHGLPPSNFEFWWRLRRRAVIAAAARHENRETNSPAFLFRAGNHRTMSTPSPANPQSQSLLVTRLPREIRDHIYLSLWNSPDHGLRQHIFWYVSFLNVCKGRLCHWRCTRTKFDKRALESVCFGHWDCVTEAEQEGISKNGTHSGRTRTRTSWLPMLLVCKGISVEISLSPASVCYLPDDYDPNMLDLIRVRDLGFRLDTGGDAHNFYWLRLDELENLRRLNIWVSATVRAPTWHSFSTNTEPSTDTVRDMLSSLAEKTVSSIVLSMPLAVDGIGPPDGGWVEGMSPRGDVRLWKRGTDDGIHPDDDEVWELLASCLSNRNSLTGEITLVDDHLNESIHKDRVWNAGCGYN
ncbi:hypothetical protein V8F33_013846 [Rhypophila sp. PSN 637]